MHFKWLKSECGAEIVALDDAAQEKFKPAVDELKRKTGLFIDPYSDTRLSPDHARLLLEFIEDCSSIEVGELPELAGMLRKSSENSWWILVVGD